MTGTTIAAARAALVDLIDGAEGLTTNIAALSTVGGLNADDWLSADTINDSAEQYILNRGTAGGHFVVGSAGGATIIEDTAPDSVTATSDAVPVSYGEPGDLGRSEHIWIGATASIDQEQRALAATPTKRVEDFTFPLMIEVIGYTTARACEAQAAALSQVIETLVAADPTIGGVDGLLWMMVTAIELDTSEHVDGPRTTLELTMAGKARLGTCQN